MLFSTIVIELIFAVILFNSVVALAEKDGLRDIPTHHAATRGVWLAGMGLFIMYIFYRWSTAQ